MNFRVAVRFFSLLALLASWHSFAQSTDLVFKIGVSGPLSGSQSFSGKDNESGAKLAVDELNSKGIIVGGRRVTFEILSQDDQADPKTGVQVAQLLVDQGAKAIIGPYNSGVTIPSSRVYSDAGIPIFTVSSNPVVTKRGFRNIFRIGPNDSQLGGTMARYASRDLQAKTAIVVDDASAYGKGVAQEFQKVAAGLGIKILSNEYTSDKATDFTTLATLVKSKKPDIIFYGGTAAQAGPFVQTLRGLGVKAPLLGGDAICTELMSELAGAAASTVTCAQGGADIAAYKNGADFAKRFHAKFAVAPQQYAVNFYDGVMMVGSAIQRSQSMAPDSIMKSVRGASYDGIGGTYAFDQDGDQTASIITVFKFADGKLVAIGQR
jgi:branched-chain amino acid transport system substrate-binding protein